MDDTELTDLVRRAKTVVDRAIPFENNAAAADITALRTTALRTILTSLLDGPLDQ